MYNIGEKPTIVLLYTYTNHVGRRETKFSGANGDREIFIFPAQLTTSRIDNLTRLIHTLAMCGDHTIYQNIRNIEEKPTIILLYTYINRHAGTPNQKNLLFNRGIVFILT